MRLKRSSNDKRDEIQRLTKYYGKATTVGAVTNIGDNEDNNKSQRRPYSREGIGRDSIKSQTPVVLLRLFFTTLRSSYNMMDGVYVVSGDHVEKTAKVLT
jgi:hypothetical protein